METEKFMSRQKIYRVLLTALVILAFGFMAGCQSRKKFPVYQMETKEDGSEILYIDGIQYRRDGDENELAMYYNGGDVWTLAEGLGEQIGVCGYKADSGGGFAVYEAAGDGERAVLYTMPRKFYFGGRDVRLWLREDVSLGPPAAEMISHVTITWDKEDRPQLETDDSALIEGLLEAYARDSSQSVKRSCSAEQWAGCMLILHHRDYPFLQYEITGGYVSEQSMAYCQNDALEWFALPEEWAERFNLWKNMVF